jgi:hypothetical protein
MAHGNYISHFSHECYFYSQIWFTQLWPEILSLKQMKLMFSHCVALYGPYFNFCFGLLSLGILPISLCLILPGIKRQCHCCCNPLVCSLSAHYSMYWNEEGDAHNVVFLPEVTRLKYIVWAPNVWDLTCSQWAATGMPCTWNRASWFTRSVT